MIFVRLIQGERYWHFLCNSCSVHGKCIQVSSVLRGSRAGDILEQIYELRDSGTVLVAYHANDPGPGMAQNKDLTMFKLFTADIGLFITLAFKDKDFTENDIYSKLLNGKLQANLGYIYENARIMREILLYTKDYQKDGSLECVPIMWAQFI